MGDDPNKLFTKLFFSLAGAPGDVSSLRRIAKFASAEVEAQIIKENTQWLEGFINDPKNDQVFLDKAKFLENQGSPAAMAEKLAAKELATFQGSIDAASLVFMHSALDAGMLDLFRVIHQADPAALTGAVEAKQASLKDVREKGYDALRNDHIEDFIKQIDRKSVIEKTDKLLVACKPEGYERKDFVFDRDRLIKIDDLRHGVVHGERPKGPIPKVEEYVSYLSETGLFFWGMVNFRFGVKLDPTYLP